MGQADFVEELTFAEPERLTLVERHLAHQPCIEVVECGWHRDIEALSGEMHMVSLRYSASGHRTGQLLGLRPSADCTAPMVLVLSQRFDAVERILCPVTIATANEQFDWGFGAFIEWVAAGSEAE